MIPPPTRRPWIMVILAALLVFGLVYAIKLIGSAPEVGGPGGAAPDGLPPAAVYVQTIVQETAQDEAQVTGSLKAAAKTEVAASEAGLIIEVLVDEGDATIQGAPLAKLDARRAAALGAETQAKITAAQSLVNQRTAEAARAKDDLEMKRGLLARKAISKSDILDAEQALSIAQSQLNSASDGVKEVESRLEFLKVQQDDLIIRAPFDGVVTVRHVEVGEWVSAGSVIASLVAIDPVEAWLRVPARFRNSVGNDSSSLRVRQSSTGDLFTPVKVTVMPEVKPLSQLFIVIATLENSDGKLTPGESITGIVPVGNNEPHWKFPVDALIRSSSGDFVYVAGEDGTGQRVSLKPAFEREGQIYVASSHGTLKAGDQVIVEGNERLQPGQPLMILERK
ncbi:MAG: RND family efflux transporter MFP subunit [Verrucomicrobiales bacterium]|jgi:RND family efflux transporter MFP subunit